MDGLRSGRAGGNGGIKAEHIKVWLWGIQEEEGDDKKGSGDLWRMFVRLI